MRNAKIERNTKETQIALSLDVDGQGKAQIDSGVGFLNHMLELLTVHSGFNLQVKCKGDTDVDFHHSVEDVGIALGQALKEALGDKKGIARFSDRVIPMDECAALVALDISGRPYLNFDCGGELSSGKIGDFDAELVEEFLRAFANNAGLNIYVKLLSAGNKHHEAEAIFKALAKTLGEATRIISDKIPSSKGVL
jgi:imidazoleglycerol-phosphate dehydratase